MEVAVQTLLEPPFPVEDDKTVQTPAKMNDDKICKVSLELAKDIVLHSVNRAPYHPPSTYASNMRRLVDKILTRHDILYKGMVKKLNFAEVDVHTTCRSIADELFADGKINWGRIVALYAFVARLAKHFADHGLDSDEYTTTLASYLGDYVVDKLHDWISLQGGWVSAYDLYFSASVYCLPQMFCGQRAVRS